MMRLEFLLCSARENALSVATAAEQREQLLLGRHAVHARREM